MTESRVPPQAVDIEKQVLGSMLIDKEAVAKAIELLDESCFYNPTHQKIFKAMIALFEAGAPIDSLTVVERLRSMGQLQSAEDPLSIVELTNNVTSAANVEYHAQIVLDKATARKLISASSEIATRAFSESEDVGDLLDEAESSIFRISEKRMRKSFSHIKNGMHKTIETLERIHQSQGKSVVGIPSGFPKVDEMTTGFQDSDLIIVAGRPSQGKTAFALAVAKNAALDRDRKAKVAIFSLEMSEQQLIIRLLSSEAKVNAHQLRGGKLPGEQWAGISRASGRLAQAEIYIDDTASLSILELRAKARRLKAEHDINIVIVDYLQLIAGPKNAESREREVSSISRSLKALAKELNIPVIALSQLNRGIEARTEKTPQLSDLRESGGIEQDADVVMFVHRPESYKITTIRDEELGDIPAEGIAEIIIGKQRNGPTGTVRLTFKKEYAGFEKLAPMGFEQYLPPPARDWNEPREMF